MKENSDIFGFILFRIFFSFLFAQAISWEDFIARNTRYRHLYLSSELCETCKSVRRYIPGARNRTEILGQRKYRSALVACDARNTIDPFVNFLVSGTRCMDPGSFRSWLWRQLLPQWVPPSRPGLVRGHPKILARCDDACPPAPRCHRTRRPMTRVVTRTDCSLSKVNAFGIRVIHENTPLYFSCAVDVCATRLSSLIEPPLLS